MALAGDPASQRALSPLHSAGYVLVGVILQLLQSVGPTRSPDRDVLVDRHAEVRLPVLSACHRGHALSRVHATSGAPRRWLLLLLLVGVIPWGRGVHVEGGDRRARDYLQGGLVVLRHALLGLVHLHRALGAVGTLIAAIRSGGLTSVASLAVFLLRRSHVGATGLRDDLLVDGLLEPLVVEVALLGLLGTPLVGSICSSRAVAACASFRKLGLHTVGEDAAFLAGVEVRHRVAVAGRFAVDRPCVLDRAEVADLAQLSDRAPRRRLTLDPPAPRVLASLVPLGSIVAAVAIFLLAASAADGVAAVFGEVLHLALDAIAAGVGGAGPPAAAAPLVLVHD